MRQNTSTGCGNTFHTQQTQFWELHVSTSLDRHLNFDRRFPSMHQPISHGSWIQNFKTSLPTCQRVNRLQLGRSGFLPSSTLTLETGTSTPVGTPCQNPNSVGIPCQSSHSPNTAIPAPRCGGTLFTFTFTRRRSAGPNP